MLIFGSADFIDENFRPQGSIKLVLPTEKTRPPNKSNITDLCKAFSHIQKSCLNLDITKGLLYRLSETKLHSADLRCAVQISLSNGLLSEAQSVLDDKAKLCLALVLSYSVLDSFGQPWFSDNWSRDSIHFMQNEGTLYLRPILISDIPRVPVNQDPGPVSKLAYEVKLLNHAVVLMEVFNQLNLEIPTCASTEKETEVLRQKTLEIFEKIVWDVHEGFQESVRACLTIAQSLPPDPLIDLRDRSNWNRYYDMVIKPLEFDFLTCWGSQKNPDKIIDTLGLPSVKPSVKPKRPHLTQEVFLNSHTFHQLLLTLCSDESTHTETKAAWPVD